jgi:glutaredoxin
MGVLDTMFNDTAIDVAEMEREKKEREEAAKANRGKSKFTPELRLNESTPTASVVFLTDGFKVNIHSMREFKDGREVYHKILCKGSKCELCASGHKPSTMAIYGTVDMSHSYTSKKGEIVNKPTFKILLRGIETIKVIERRKQKTKDKSLLKKLWEAQLSGSGFSTYYDFTMEDEDVELDFDEKETIETKEGSIEVPSISIPPIFEYVTDPEKMNLYTREKLKPKYEIDWSNPQHVNEWLKHHLLQTPLVDYVRLASMPKTKKEDSSKVVKEHKNDNEDTDY